jgi:hypothetical protein
MCIMGAGDMGKTRLASAAPRACPEWFGERALYIAIDPEAASLSSVLPQDKPRMEVIKLDEKKDIFAQMKEAYNHDWRTEGLTTIITDTMSMASKGILSQVTNSGRFSDKHIDLGEGIKQPMPGDYGAAQTLLMSLLSLQKSSGLNHLTLFHEREDRPEPGAAGEPIGGPDTVGKASIRMIVNWYNTVLHLTRRQKKRADLRLPLEYERVVHTTGHGIWQAKLRTHDLTNPIPEILMNPDPINIWQTLDTHTRTKKEQTL